VASIDLSDRVAVVTGASSGIGAETARVMAGCGARVVAVGRDAVRLQETVAAIAAAGGDAEGVVVDVTADDAVDAILDAAGDRIDVLCLAAGQFHSAPVHGTSVDELDALWATHVRAPFRLVQGALDRLSDGSTILFYSSTVAQVGFAPYAAYTAVKGAIEAMSRSLAIELAPRVRVNTMVPGFTATPMVGNQFPDAPGLEAGIIARTPTGALDGPASIAHLAAFLASDLGGYIDGARMVVDGGWTAQGWQQG
jgi:NAD(P)-dependent dehydrogenase (short-subunit alcohol dehydrogenase family)